MGIKTKNMYFQTFGTSLYSFETPYSAHLKHFFTSNLNSLFLSAAALHQGYFLGKVNSLDVIELVKIPDMETKNWRHGCLLKNPQLPCANRPYIIIGQNLRRGI